MRSGSEFLLLGNGVLEIGRRHARRVEVQHSVRFGHARLE